MEEKLDLHRLEASLYRSFWQDGLLDVFIGTGVLLIGFAWLAALVPLGAVVPAVLMPFWPIARKRLITPRAGYVRFSDARTRHERKQLRMLVGIGTGVFVLSLLGGIYAYFRVAASASDAFLAMLVPALPNVLLALLLALGSLLFAIWRYLLYAILFVLVGVVGLMMGMHPGWQLVGAGALTLLAGLALLTHFLLHHPLPEPAP